MAAVGKDPDESGSIDNPGDRGRPPAWRNHAQHTQQSEPSSGLPGVESDELAEYQRVREDMLTIQQDEQLAAYAQRLLEENAEDGES